LVAVTAEWESGPLSQWLVNGLTEARLPIVCVETRHTKVLLEAEQINKCDRNDARDIARMMRADLFKPVHVGCFASHYRSVGLMMITIVYILLMQCVAAPTEILA
jgi:hypothetical protein